MADDAPRALLCLIEGESAPFRVEPKGSMDIRGLKELIEERGINVTEHTILAKDLILWKVRMTPWRPATAQLTLLQVNLAHPKINERTRKEFIGKSLPHSVQLKRELAKISDYWPATTPPNPEHLHIIVELPSGASCFLPSYVNLRSFLRRCGVLDDVDQPPPSRKRWLKELHSKIWNREDLEPILFRKVEVTRAHYDALQDCLNQKYPDRDTEEYDGSSHNVLSDKLDILKRWPTAAEADNHEDRVDDEDSEINSSFPFTLRYLDLSTLRLKNVPDRFPLALFVRQEYDHISTLISGGPRNNDGLVMVSGQPGTGEVLVSLSRTGRI
jgi:hypothetical protein